MRRVVRLVGDEATYSVLSDRAVIPPYGVGGGGAAAPVSVSIRTDGAEAALATPGKATGMLLRRESVVVMESAGGGGYGDPLAREPRLVAADVNAGYVSPERARSDYGVVVDAAGAVDEVATTALRTRLAGDAPMLAIVADETPCYAGIKGRHRVLRMRPEVAAQHALGANQLVELVGRNPAPLRAWVKLDEAAPAAAIPLDEFGRRVLGAAAGDRVRLRRLGTVIAPGERARGQR
jgi:N-methylhydantoinase B